MFLQFGCVAYKVNLNDEAYTYRGQSDLIISEKKERTPHCGFAQLTVITAGIIPAGCKRTYVATSTQKPEAVEIGTVNYLQGWITLFLTPFSSWQYFDKDQIETQINNKITSSE